MPHGCIRHKTRKVNQFAASNTHVPTFRLLFIAALENNVLPPLALTRLPRQVAAFSRHGETDRGCDGKGRH